MTLLLRNLQKSVDFNFKKMRTDIMTLRRILRIERYDVAVICMDDNQVKELNRLYRGHDTSTDVLSFPAHENLAPGRLPDPWSDMADLGDVFLGMSYIQRKCEEQKGDMDVLIPVTVIHGFCHLIGYKHETDAQWKQMYKRELQIIKEFNKVTGEELVKGPLTSKPPDH
ncbi:LOW QUALITY PROTEIN: endoribonuclease YbeY-like [Amphiura filiformis]|uniref:LOW QUALITY PROTEIN: endoribonuclease YbeY-like n=1 Tax=Amphiura filiformis TaxID=82378 RepID=UPI003B21E7F1